MKSIINGIRYDTDKATAIGSASHGYANDLHHWAETLYKTPRSGRFFIAGEGGPMSKYSRQTGQNNWSGSSRIIPVSLDDALKWCEQYLDGDEWTEYFPEQIEDA